MSSLDGDSGENVHALVKPRPGQIRRLTWGLAFSALAWRLVRVLRPTKADAWARESAEAMAVWAGASLETEIGRMEGAISVQTNVAQSSAAEVHLAKCTSA